MHLLRMTKRDKVETAGKKCVFYVNLLCSISIYLGQLYFYLLLPEQKIILPNYYKSEYWMLLFAINQFINHQVLTDSQG